MSYLDEIFGGKDPKKMPAHLFHEVRGMDYATAQKADVSKQHYTVCPRQWYVDAVFVCRDCGKEFVFSANEQRFWYEDRQFFIESLPKQCIDCRKAERNRLELRKRYDSLIAQALGQCPVELKRDVVAIINSLEAAEDEIPAKMIESRSKLYSQLKKLSPDKKL